MSARTLLAGVPVLPSTMVGPGRPILLATSIVAHPLDIIAMRCGDDIDRRLELAMAWLVGDALRHFDRLQAAR